MKKFAIIIPITSRQSNRETLISNISHLSQFLSSTFDSNTPFFIYFGVDNDDSLIAELLHNYFKANMPVEIVYFESQTPPNICLIWRRLVNLAYTQEKCNYFLLLGDDLRFYNENRWVESLRNEFESTNDYGCVSIKDLSAPGFSTFPVISFKHLEIFGQVIPPIFINQDGDPFLFEIYRHFKCHNKPLSRFLEMSIAVKNLIGGVQLENATYVVPRYTRQHINWKSEILENAVIQVNEYVTEKNISIMKVISCDIVIPCYNYINEENLEKKLILLNNVPENVNLKFILIIDKLENEISKTDLSYLNEIQFQNFGQVIVRFNQKNEGASHSRNVGLDESAADIVIFLDDDVIPDDNLVSAYVNAYESYGDKYDGFAGVTLLQNSQSLWDNAVLMSNVSYFWDIALKMKETPWAITANQCISLKKSPRFDSKFLKTGVLRYQRSFMISLYA